MEYRYQGIILGKYDIAEVDRIYSIYTLEAGKIRVLAKGVKNPNAKLAGSLEPITYSEVTVSRTKGKGKITGALGIEIFSSIKSDYEMMARVFYAFGILEKMIAAEEKDPRVFKLIFEFLSTAEEMARRENQEDKKDVITLGFLFKFLDISGYGLNMEYCMKCGEKLEPEGNFFSAAVGGVFCHECAGPSGRRIKISSGAIKLIRLFSGNAIKNLPKINVSPEDIKNAKTVLGEMVRWVTS